MRLRCRATGRRTPHFPRRYRFLPNTCWRDAGHSQCRGLRSSHRRPPLPWRYKCAQNSSRLRSCPSCKCPPCRPHRGVPRSCRGCSFHSPGRLRRTWRKRCPVHTGQTGSSRPGRTPGRTGRCRPDSAVQDHKLRCRRTRRFRLPGSCWPQSCHKRCTGCPRRRTGTRWSASRMNPVPCRWCIRRKRTRRHWNWTMTS